jgi:predicted CoA-binding protein
VNHDSYPDSYIRGILADVKTVAMVGASANRIRPSYFVFKYLLEKGYDVSPINPGRAGKDLLGQKIYASLADLPEPVDMVDIFRGSEAAGPITDEVIEHGAKVVWMQLTVRNDEAAKRAEAAGLRVVMNRCPKIEYGRLSGEISWMGVNSKKITAKRPLMTGNRVQSLGIRR